MTAPAAKKKKTDYRNAWAEARRLIWHYRWRLVLGLVLMVPSRLSGLVLPAVPKYLIDEHGNATSRNDVVCAAWRSSDDDAHRPRRIGLCPSQARGCRQCGSARRQMQKLPAGKFHSSGSVVNMRG